MDGSDRPGFFRKALEASTVALLVLERNGVIRYHTVEAARMMRGVGANLVATKLADLFPVEVAEAVAEYVLALSASEAGRSVFFEAPCKLTDGHESWLGMSGVNLLADPDVCGIVMNLADRTDVHAARAHQVTDALTGLANRYALSARLATADNGVLVMIDLDGFKAINDTYGHSAGDELLVAVARRLTPVFGATSLICRLGGDEFLVFLPESALNRAWQMAETALASIEAPVGPRGLRVTASIGITHVQDGDWNAALSRADKAMYRAKAAGRAQICAHPDEEAVWAERRAFHGSALANSLKRNQSLESVIASLSDQLRRNERTGLLNDAAYRKDIVAIDTVARHDGSGYAIAVCDVDHFGRYNNHYGLDAGDAALRSVADALQSACRPGDLVYRYGGEEIVVVFKDADLQDAAKLAERLRIAVEQLEIRHENRPAPNVITISAGVAALDVARHPSHQDVFNEANGNMRAAKDAGRNQVSPAAANS